MRKKRERQRSERDRAATWQPDLVLGDDRRKALLRVGDRDARRDAGAGEARAVLFEEEAVGAGDGQQIDVGIETHSPGDHRRVPVSSWAMPPESATRVASEKPASRSWPVSSVGAGRYATDLGR